MNQQPKNHGHLYPVSPNLCGGLSGRPFPEHLETVVFPGGNRCPRDVSSPLVSAGLPGRGAGGFGAGGLCRPASRRRSLQIRGCTLRSRGAGGVHPRVADGLHVPYHDRFQEIRIRASGLAHRIALLRRAGLRAAAGRGCTRLGGSRRRHGRTRRHRPGGWKHHPRQHGDHVHERCPHVLWRPLLSRSLEARLLTSTAAWFSRLPGKRTGKPQPFQQWL